MPRAVSDEIRFCEWQLRRLWDDLLRLSIKRYRAVQDKADEDAAIYWRRLVVLESDMDLVEAKLARAWAKHAPWRAEETEPDAVP